MITTEYSVAGPADISIAIEISRCQVPLNFYKQIYTYLQITNIVVE